MEDERTVYSTYRGKRIIGNHTITQVVKIIPNETATLRVEHLSILVIVLI